MYNGTKIPLSRETLKSLEEADKVTYEDVCKELFVGKRPYYISSDDGIETSSCAATKYDIEDFAEGNEALDKEQLQSIINLNKLANVAKYLNEGWAPDWNKFGQSKWSIFISNEGLKLVSFASASHGNVIFKSEELAQKAIEILGEDIIKSALTLNY